MPNFKKAIQPILFLAFLILILCLKKSGLALAAYVPLPGSVPFGNLPNPGVEGDTGVQIAIKLVSAFYQNTKYIIGAVAVGFITYAGLRMVISQGKEEQIKEQKDILLYGVIGLALISIAEAASLIFSYDEQSKCFFLQNPQCIAGRSILFSEQVGIVIIFIKYIIGAVAVLFIIRAASKLIVAGYSSEVIDKEKKNLIYGILGLIGIIVADTVINGVLYKINPNANYQGDVQPAIDLSAAQKEIVGLTEFLVTYIGPLTILLLIVGALYYLFAGADESRLGTAIRIIVNSLIGLVVIYGAYAIVSTFIGGSIDYTPTP